MKPENAHLISLRWHLVLLGFCFGVWWSLSVRGWGGPGNKTQPRAGRAEELGTGKPARPLCCSRWGVPSPYKTRPSGNTGLLPLPLLWWPYRECSFCRWAETWTASSTWNLVIHKHFPQLNFTLKTFHLQRQTWKMAEMANPKFLKRPITFQIPVHEVSNNILENSRALWNLDVIGWILKMSFGPVP